MTAPCVAQCNGISEWSVMPFLGSKFLPTCMRADLE